MFVYVLSWANKARPATKNTPNEGHRPRARLTARGGSFHWAKCCPVMAERDHNLMQGARAMGNWRGALITCLSHLRHAAFLTGGIQGNGFGVWAERKLSKGADGEKADGDGEREKEQGWEILIDRSEEQKKMRAEEKWGWIRVAGFPLKLLFGLQYLLVLDNWDNSQAENATNTCETWRLNSSFVP